MKSLFFRRFFTAAMDSRQTETVNGSNGYPEIDSLVTRYYAEPSKALSVAQVDEIRRSVALLAARGVSVR